MFRFSRPLFAVFLAAALLASAACSGGEEETTAAPDASGVTIESEDLEPPTASSASSAMDLLRQEPLLSEFLAAVEGTKYEEQLECAGEEEALNRGWTNVLAPVDGTFGQLAANGPSFDADQGFGDFTAELLAASGVAEGTEVTFDVDGGIGSMTWTAGSPPTEGDAAQAADPTPGGTQWVLFAVKDGRAVLPTDANTPALSSVATCGATSTLQLLLLGATVAEPDDPSSNFPAIVPDEASS